VAGSIPLLQPLLYEGAGPPDRKDIYPVTSYAIEYGWSGGGSPTPILVSRYMCTSKEEAEQALELYNSAKAEGNEISIHQAMDRVRRANGTPLPLPTTPYNPDKGPANIYLMEISRIGCEYPNWIKACVVLAHSKAEALSINPGGEEMEGCYIGPWPRPQFCQQHIQVTELGTYVGNDKGAGSVLIISYVGGDHHTPWGDVEQQGVIGKRDEKVTPTA
jgi:hypothetical protein